MVYEAAVCVDKDWRWWKQEDMVQLIQYCGRKVFVGVLHEDSAMVEMARVKVRRYCICSS